MVFFIINLKNMNLKTKIPLIIFTILFVISFPYSMLIYESDFISSLIPGWHTTINSFGFTDIFRFILLSIVVFGYCKLSKITKTMPLKYFLMHISFTIPSIIISKISLYNFVSFENQNIEETYNKIENIIRIGFLINTFFIIVQIFSVIYYYKILNKVRY